MIILYSKFYHIAVLDDIFLAFRAHPAFFAGFGVRPVESKSCQFMTSARMNLSSKSEWMEAPACGAVEFALSSTLSFRPRQ